MAAGAAGGGAWALCQPRPTHSWRRTLSRPVPWAVPSAVAVGPGLVLSTAPRCVALTRPFTRPLCVSAHAAFDDDASSGAGGGTAGGLVGGAVGGSVGGSASAWSGLGGSLAHPNDQSWREAVVGCLPACMHASRPLPVATCAGRDVRASAATAHLRDVAANGAPAASESRVQMQHGARECCAGREATEGMCRSHGDGTRGQRARVRRRHTSAGGPLVPFQQCWKPSNNHRRADHGRVVRHALNGYNRGGHIAPPRPHTPFHSCLFTPPRQPSFTLRTTYSVLSHRTPYCDLCVQYSALCTPGTRARGQRMPPHSAQAT